MTGFSKKIDSKLSDKRIRDMFSERGWLAGRSERARRLILSCGRRRNYVAGEAVYRIGDRPEGLYGLINGGVSVSVPNDVGTDHTVYQASPGFWIGDLALFADQHRLVTVIAVADTEMLHLPRARLVPLVKENPQLIRDFYALSHVNTALAMRLLANMAIPNAKKRLVAWLLFSDEGLEASQEWIVVSQERLAAMVAMSLPTVQRLLKSLSARNLVEVGYGRIRIRDRGALANFVQD